MSSRSKTITCFLRPEQIAHFWQPKDGKKAAQMRGKAIFPPPFSLFHHPKAARVFLIRFFCQIIAKVCVWRRVERTGKRLGGLGGAAALPRHKNGSSKGAKITPVTRHHKTVRCDGSACIRLVPVTLVALSVTSI